MSFLAKTDTGVLVNRYVMTFAQDNKSYELTHEYFFPMTDSVKTCNWLT